MQIFWNIIIQTKKYGYENVMIKFYLGIYVAKFKATKIK